MENAKPAPTPRIKVTEAELTKITTSPALSGADATRYRSAAMRAAYLGVDRPDITETVKALSQAMSAPREGHMGMLKRLVRYLAGARRKAIVYEKQSPKDAQLEVIVDSDWAGCLRTRRSTSGMCMMRGKHLLRHSSTLQCSIGLSSPEAEYYALVRGACYGLGMQAHYADLGISVKLRVYSDSSSARSFAKRQGLGKQRHVQTRFLWLQDRVRLKHVEVRSIPGTANPADMLTKALTRRESDRYCWDIGLRDRESHTPLPSGAAQQDESAATCLR